MIYLAIAFGIFMVAVGLAYITSKTDKNVSHH